MPQHWLRCRLPVAANRNPAGLILLNPPPPRQLLTNYYRWLTFGLSAIFLAGHVPGIIPLLRLNRSLT